MDKIDLVLQGSFNHYSYEIAKHYLNLSFVNNIIISCWENDNISNCDNDKIIFIQSEDINPPGIGNRNRQIKSSLAGIKSVSTEFCAKLRSDQKISLDSMYLMFNFYKKHKEREITFYDNYLKPNNRICVAGIFRPFPFHPRDHIFWGNTKDLIDVFDIPYDNNIDTNPNYSLYTRAEAYIASWYYAKFDNDIYNYINNPQKYLVDDCPNIKEALLKSEFLGAKVFKPFPRINFEWPKHGLHKYHYDYTEKILGEYWSDE